MEKYGSAVEEDVRGAVAGAVPAVGHLRADRLHPHGGARLPAVRVHPILVRGGRREALLRALRKLVDTHITVKGYLPSLYY